VVAAVALLVVVGAATTPGVDAVATLGAQVHLVASNTVGEVAGKALLGPALGE